MTAFSQTIRAVAYSVLWLAAGLTGCAVGPSFQTPKPLLPTSWSTPIGAVNAAMPNPVDRWWTAFNDATLNELVGQAVAHNPDLDRALAAVAQARAQRVEVAGAYYPQVDASASGARSREVLELPPVFAPGSGGAVAFTTNVFLAGFDASWELDLFGRLRRSVEAADANAQATEEAANEARLTLIGDVARFYVDARGLQRRIEVTESTIRAQQDTAELTAVRYRAGTGTGLDAVRAEAQWQTTRAELPSLEAALRADIYHLSVLIGQPPATLLPRLSLAQPVPQADSASVSAGIPADILRRRPDIREEERRLAQATANVGIAVADLYPSLTLAGSIGVNSPQLSTLHRTNLSGVWSIAPKVGLPVLDGGRRRAAVKEQEAQLRAARAQYETAVLNAEEEVENALTSYTTARERRQALREAAGRDEDALKLSTELYVKGLGTFLDVLDSQRSLFQVQSDLAVSEAAVSVDLIALYKAFGGGWRASP